MTKRISIRLFRVRFLAGLNQVEALLDLAKQRHKILALLHGEARQDLLFLAEQARDQFLIKRLALAAQPKAEFAAVVFVLDALDQLPVYQRGDGAADGGFVRARALRN